MLCGSPIRMIKIHNQPCNNYKGDTHAHNSSTLLPSPIGWLSNSSYSAVFLWERDIWVIILKKKCLCINSILMFWQFCRTSDSFYQYYCEAILHSLMDAPTEVTWWDARSIMHKHRSKHCFCYMARAGTTEHLNMLSFGKICVWRYVISPYYLLIN